MLESPSAPSPSNVSASSTGLVARPECRLHDPGPGHPEQPARYDAIMTALDRAGLRTRMRDIPSRAALGEELSWCHTEAYLGLAAAEVRRGAPMLCTGDTSLCKHSWDAAIHAVGGTLNAVEAVYAGQVANALCVVRPPGHHATIDQGMGFCLLNNVAIAARYAQRRHGAARVLIADWDVHHGNGTQDIFYEDDSVLFFSTHQYPWYPGTGSRNEEGAGAGTGTTRNCPFPAGAGHREILGAFERELLQLADEFRPDLVLISAGFDSRQGDPLGDFCLTDSDFGDLTLLMADIARRHCGGRLVSVIEGGYRLEGLAAATTAHAAALVETARA